MHEMSLTEGVLRILEEQAAVSHYSRVKTVWLEIGALSQVDPQSMAFCFEAIKGGTIAEAARLEIIAVPGTAWCMVCSDTVSIAQRYDPCPRCGGHQVTVSGGEDMRIKELEVE